MFCQKAKLLTSLFFAFSFFASDIALALEPQIGFAHRVNDWDEIGPALQNGAIGIELDVCRGNSDWWVSHNDAGLCNNGSAETVDEWLGKLREELSVNSTFRKQLVMVWVDIKSPSNSTLGDVVDSIHDAGLPADLRFIYDLTAFNTKNRKGFKRIYKKLEGNEGISFCLGKSCDGALSDVAELYRYYRDHGFDRGGFNQGDSINIDETYLTEANKFRNIGDPYRFKFVHTWTNKLQSSMEDYINPAKSYYTTGQIIGEFGTQWDGAIMKPIITKFKNAVAKYASTQRLATKSDNLFGLNGGNAKGKSLDVGDFNGDGFQDVVIGIPGDSEGKGKVEVLYGSANGLVQNVVETWQQDSSGIKGTGEKGDDFGASLAVGDFDGDGFSDLAVGVPGEDLGVIIPAIPPFTVETTIQEYNAGMVNIIYGSAGGLSASGDQSWHQNTTDISGTSQVDDNFGASLTAGDFNGDGYADLAIGTPGEDVGDVNNAGAVNLLYGTSSGLAAANNQLWHQDSTGIKGVSETEDKFGSSLSSGDFNGDGFDDLAIGVPGEAIGGEFSAGMVNVLYGASNGITDSFDQDWNQDSASIKGSSESGDNFGVSLATGDFNGDGYADLAIGVSGEDLSSTNKFVSHAGLVNIIYGASASGLHENGNQDWSQDTAGIKGSSESYDNFGASLVVGDFDGDGFSDLAIGVPGEAIGDISATGMVNVIYGATNTGLQADGDKSWHQDSVGVSGANETSDNFGSSLAAGDFNGDGASDLVIGVPGEGAGNAGSVRYINGSSSTSGGAVEPGKIIVTAITGNVSEDGGTASFSIKLERKPTANVTIALSSSDTTEGTVSPSSITFTSSNWNSTQRVTVRGVDDLADDGPIDFHIVTAAAISNDTGYHGVNSTDVFVINLDDDGSAIEPVVVSINVNVAKTSEFGDIGILVVSRTGDLSNPINVKYSVSGTADSGVDFIDIGTSITLRAGVSRNGIAIQVNADSENEGDETVIISLDSSSNYNLSSASVATITINDFPGSSPAETTNPDEDSFPSETQDPDNAENSKNEETDSSESAFGAMSSILNGFLIICLLGWRLCGALVDNRVRKMT